MKLLNKKMKKLKIQQKYLYKNKRKYKNLKEIFKTLNSKFIHLKWMKIEMLINIKIKFYEIKI